VARAVRDALPGVEVRLVRGPQAGFPDPPGIRVLHQPPALLGPLLGADLAVTAAGNSLLEAAAVGVPTLALVMADNQLPGARALAEAGATQLCDPASPDAVAAAVRRLAGDRRLRREQAERGRALVDGHGALRVAFALWRLLQSI
jgi:UDP-2,4-diacetamido-2,4,6-trideoxy-beta-L-altropyranose hydrolase